MHAGSETRPRHELLDRLRGRLAESVGEFVDSFYADLALQEGPRAILERLPHDEVARLKAKQVAHLLSLLDDRTDPAVSADRGRRIGRTHAMAGVDVEWYAAAAATHHQQIFELAGHVAEPGDHAWIFSTVSARLMRDLQAALAGYRDVDAAQHRVMTRVTRAVATAGTIPDLVRGVLDACAGIEGMAAGFFGRPDNGEALQIEMGVGSGVDEFMAAVAAHSPAGLRVGGDVTTQSPTVRAWRLGGVERSDSYLTDPTTAPWHEVAQRLGWRSSAAVPLVDASGRPRAVVTFFSRWPGYFASAARQALLGQLQSLLAGALSALEVRGPVASRVSTFAARSTYLTQLHGGEVEMLFQPIVELRTGRVTKLEALARLRGPDGLLLPREFLPAFGDEELIRLFELGLDQSLRAIRAWEGEGFTAGVSLNLPSVSSRDDRYVAVVERTLGRHHVEPGRLTLELLETGYVDGRSRWRGPVLDQFHELGVRLAQDDLGSGYSSLLRLRHFAFDDVKLDQSLIRGQEFTPRGALNFIQPLTSLAHSMGLNVVVEGLENAGLVEAALMLGADAGQGYGISRPIPAREVAVWVDGFRLDLDRASPRTPLGALAAHVSWEHRATAIGSGARQVSHVDLGECPLDGFIARTGDAGGHLAEAHAAVHRTARIGSAGDGEHLRWWRVLTRMLGGIEG